jgi:hypothetical protein
VNLDDVLYTGDDIPREVVPAAVRGRLSLLKASRHLSQFARACAAAKRSMDAFATAARAARRTRRTKK